MLQRASSFLSVVLLAACQSSGDPSMAQAEWQVSQERSHSELRADVQGLSALIAARSAAYRTPADLEGGRVEELATRLNALGGQLDQLMSIMTANGAGPAVDAAFSGDVQPPTIQASEDAIPPLEGALLLLRRQHALHCENIANASVPGYKRRSLVLTTTSVEGTALQVPQLLRRVHHMSQGTLELTGNQLDLGIEGEGFFEVQLPNGDLRYTRNGSFRQDVNGRLVTAEGYLLTDQVSIPEVAQGISLAPDGQVFALLDGNTPQQIGMILLHRVRSADCLKLMGRGFFVPTVSSGSPRASLPGIQGAGLVKQGYVERSNVEITSELIGLQLAERQAAAVRRALAGFGVYAR